jgi:hypothetical protein
LDFVGDENSFGQSGNSNFLGKNFSLSACSFVEAKRVTVEDNILCTKELI